MNDIRPAPATMEQARQKRIGLWGAAISTVLGLTFLVFWAYNVFVLQNGRFDFSDKVLMPVTILMFLAGVVGFFLIWRDHHRVGLWSIYLAVLIPPVMAALVFNGFYLIALAYLAAFAPMAIVWLFPKGGRQGAVIAAAFAALAVLGIEIWHPAFRGTTATLTAFAPYVIAIGILSLGAFSAWQAVIGNIRTKLIIAFSTIAVLSAAIFAISAQQWLNRSLTESIGNSHASLANAQAVQIGQKLSTELDLLRGLAMSRPIRERAAAATLANTLTQDQIKQLDAQWQADDAANNSADPLVANVLYDSLSPELKRFQAEFPENVEVFLTDASGLSVATTDRTSDYLQADEDWWQAAYKNGEYIGQPEFDASSKTLAINMAVAVRGTSADRIVGILRTTININSLADILAAGQIGQTGHADVYLPNSQIVTLVKTGSGGTELNVTKADADITRALPGSPAYFTLPVSGTPSFISASKVGVLSAEGSVDATLIKDLGWQVVVQQSQTEALAPVEAQTRDLVLLAIVLALVAAAAGIGLAQLLAGPIVRLNAVAAKVAAGDLTVQAKVETRDETGALAGTFNNMVAQLRDLIGSLEQRVAAATRNLLTASEVGRSVAQVQELDTLLKNAVDLIRERFDLYYAQVYLLDPTGRRLVLRAGTGDVGRQLMASHHALPLDLASLNGTAAMESRSVVVEDTQKSAIHRRNSLLPDTRSEMVIPLVVGSRLVGTLDIQSSDPGALNEGNRPAFEALAGQLAIAVQNASLLAEAEEARADLEAQTARMVRSRWQDYLNAVDRGERVGFTYDLSTLNPCDEPVSYDADGQALVAPIRVLNSPVGVLKFEGEASWKADDTVLVNTVAHQLGQQVENLRLIAQADQYRAEAEQALVRLTRAGWDEQLAAHPDVPTGFTYDRNLISPLPAEGNGEPEGELTQPLEVRGEKIGALSVSGSGEAQAEAAELLAVVGEQLSSRLENLRLFEASERSQMEVERRAQQLAAVAEVSTVSAGELDVDKMLHSVVSRTQRKFGLYHAHIFLHDEKSGELRIVACGWPEGDPNQQVDEKTVISMKQERSLVARAARTGQPVIVNDVRSDPDWLPNAALPNTAAEMAIPLQLGNQILGVLDVQSDRVNAFSEEDANIQTTLASQVAIALQNARSFQQAQRQAQRETALNAISQQIQGATTVDAVLQIAARELGRALGAPLTIAQLGMKETSDVGPDGHNGHHG